MKVALISDLHFGVKQSDSTFQKSQLSFFEKQLVEELKLRSIDTIFVLGDVFDTRQSINVQTSNVVLHLFKDIFEDFKIHVIVGNHDLYYKNTTSVNSLKQLDLLSNVTVYETPKKMEFDGHSVTFLPWITDYKSFKGAGDSEYCFAHLDVAGFMMDKINMCSEGISIKQLADNYKHVYTGHFHTRSKKKIGDCDVTYIGSPYQLTRIDMGQDRGCTILDLDTNTTELIVNTESIRYVKLTYPDVPENIGEFVAHNYVDIDIPYDLSDESKKIFDYMQTVNTHSAISVTQNIGKKPELTVSADEKDLSNIDLFSLFKSYTDQLTNINKEQIYSELTTLYNDFKRRIKWNRKQSFLQMDKLKAFTNILRNSYNKKEKLQNFHILFLKILKVSLKRITKLLIQSMLKNLIQIFKNTRKISMHCC